MRQKWKLPSKSFALAVRAPKPKPPRPRNCACAVAAAQTSIARKIAASSRRSRRSIGLVYTFNLLFNFQLTFDFQTYFSTFKLTFQLLNFSTSSTLRDVFVTGATGYLGRRLVAALL